MHADHGTERDEGTLDAFIAELEQLPEAEISKKDIIDIANRVVDNHLDPSAAVLQTLAVILDNDYTGRWLTQADVVERLTRLRKPIRAKTQARGDVDEWREWADACNDTASRCTPSLQWALRGLAGAFREGRAAGDAWLRGPGHGLAQLFSDVSSLHQLRTASVDELARGYAKELEKHMKDDDYNRVLPSVRAFAQNTMRTLKLRVYFRHRLRMTTEQAKTEEWDAYCFLLTTLLAQPPHTLPQFINNLCRNQQHQRQWITFSELLRWWCGNLLIMTEGEFIATHGKALVEWRDCFSLTPAQLAEKREMEKRKAAEESKKQRLDGERRLLESKAPADRPVWERDEIATPDDRLKMIADALKQDKRDDVYEYRALLDGTASESERNEFLGVNIRCADDGVPIVMDVPSKTMRTFLLKRPGDDWRVLALALYSDASSKWIDDNSTVIARATTHKVGVFVVRASRHPIADLTADSLGFAAIDVRGLSLDLSVIDRGVPGPVPPTLAAQINERLYVEARAGADVFSPGGKVLADVQAKIVSDRVHLVASDNPCIGSCVRDAARALLTFSIDFCVKKGVRIDSEVMVALEVHLAFGRVWWNGEKMTSLLQTVMVTMSTEQEGDGGLHVLDHEVDDATFVCDYKPMEGRGCKPKPMPFTPFDAKLPLDSHRARVSTELAVQQHVRTSEFVTPRTPPYATNTGLAFPHVLVDTTLGDVVCPNVVLTGRHVVVEFTVVEPGGRIVHEEAMLRAMGQRNKSDGRAEFSFDIVTVDGTGAYTHVRKASGRSWGQAAMVDGVVRSFWVFDAYDADALKGKVCAIRACFVQTPATSDAPCIIKGVSAKFLLYKQRFCLDGATLRDADAFLPSGARADACAIEFNEAADHSGGRTDVDDRLRAKYSDVDMERQLKVATEAATKRSRDDFLQEWTKRKCSDEENKKLKSENKNLKSGMKLMASAIMDTTRGLDGDTANGDELYTKVQQIMEAHSIQLSTDGEMADEDEGNGDCEALVPPQANFAIEFSANHAGEHRSGNRVKLVKNFENTSLVHQVDEISRTLDIVPPSPLRFRLTVVCAESRAPVNGCLSTEKTKKVSNEGMCDELVGTWEELTRDRGPKLFRTPSVNMPVRLALGAPTGLEGLLRTAYSDTFVIRSLYQTPAQLPVRANPTSGGSLVVARPVAYTNTPTVAAQCQGSGTSASVMSTDAAAAASAASAAAASALASAEALFGAVNASTTTATTTPVVATVINSSSE